MKWTDPKPPTEGESYYDHVRCETPLGEIFIEWKSWKEQPSFDVEFKGDYYKWIGCEYSLDDAKKFGENYIKEVSNKLNEFLKQ